MERFILRVILAYRDNHEKVCSQTSVSTCKMSKEKKISTQKSSILLLHNLCIFTMKLGTICATDLELHVKFEKAIDSVKRYSGQQTT